MAKHVGLALHHLLGSARPRIQAYASTPLLPSPSAYVDFVSEMRALGFKAIKFHCTYVYENDMAIVTGRTTARAYVDRGYRGHGLKREGLDVHVSHTRGIASPTVKRELRRRNAIEPVIGHMKQDGHLERNALKGSAGDVVNALLCAIGHNLRLLLAWFRKLLCLILAAVLLPSSTPLMRPA